MEILKVFGYIMLFFLIIGAILFAIILGFDLKENDTATLIFVFASLPIIIILFIPYLDFASKKAYFYESENQQVTELSELKNELLKINEFDSAVIAKAHPKDENHLIFTWNYVNTKWYGIISKEGLNKVYELHVKLNDKKKRATLIDISKSVKWGLKPSEVKLNMSFFRGVSTGIEIGKVWGIKENFEPGKVYDYKFSPQEIKNPVSNTILRNGWDLEMGMW